VRRFREVLTGFHGNFLRPNDLITELLVNGRKLLAEVYDAKVHKPAARLPSKLFCGIRQSSTNAGALPVGIG